MNLGTPEAPTPQAVGVYLREFLMDPWVIDIPYWLRWPLVNVLIVPRRKHSSAEAHANQKSGARKGSPFTLQLSLAFTQKIAKKNREEPDRLSLPCVMENQASAKPLRVSKKQNLQGDAYCHYTPNMPRAQRGLRWKPARERFVKVGLRGACGR